MTIDEVRDRLEQAMEVFVVRKERATTTRNFESKVSVTFTRRRATGHEGGLIMADTDSVVTVVCQTLKESDRSRNTGLVPC
nr:hypothetical protein BaRGS_024551 [Batillaria attramentaria]